MRDSRLIIGKTFIRRAFISSAVAGSAVTCGVVLGVVIGARAESTVLRAQDAAAVPSAQVAPVDAAAAAAHLSGQWKLNKDLSTDVPDAEAPAAAASSGGGGRGGSGGGGGGGGRGGRGGGMGGGRGGMGGRGGSGYSGRSGGSQDQMLQARAVMRELMQPPALVTIVANATSVSLTDNEGTIRKFTIDGTKQNVDLGTAKMDVTSHWDGNALVQEIAAGTLKVTRKYQPTDEGHQLVVTVATTSAAGGASAPTTFVYDK